LKNRFNLSKLITLSVLAALVTVATSAQALASLNFTRTGLVGVVQGQTVRVNVAYVPEESVGEFVPCVRIVLVDEGGRVVKEMTARVAAGESLELVMPYSESSRAQKVRAVVTLLDTFEAMPDVVATLEVLETRSGKTSFLLPAVRRAEVPMDQ
jgi:hypothetical protein